MCQVHTGAYVSLLAPAKTDYTACHPRNTTSYILHVVPITTHTHDRRKSIGIKETKKRKEDEKEERKEKTRKRNKEKGKGRKRKDQKSKKRQDKKRKQGKEKRKREEEKRKRREIKMSY